MDSHTYFATEMHRYRAEQMTRAVGRARLIASLPRRTRSLKLGTYRLTLTKLATGVPSTV